MLAEKFKKTLKAKGRSDATLESIGEALSGGEAYLKKPLEDATFDDLLSYIEKLKADGKSMNTISLRCSQILQFFKFCLNQTDDEKYNRLIRKFKDVSAERQPNDLNPQDMLAPEDVKKLINVATMERDRCIVAALFESGMRIGELMALRISNVEIDEVKKEVTFHIPNMRGKGTKTGARTVVCLEIHGYVTDWLKCHPDPNPTSKFINISQSGVDKQVRRLFKRAKSQKPSNLHNFRHSAITYACVLRMKSIDISMRFWGIPNSNMLSVYIHLSEQVQADAYRDAKGMGTGNGTTIINPLSVRCVDCGRQISTGDLCVPCKTNKELKQRLAQSESALAELRENQELVKTVLGDINDFKKTLESMKKLSEGLASGTVTGETKIVKTIKLKKRNDVET